MKTKCSVGGCAGETHARGWCRRHYVRWQRNGDPEGSARKHKTESEAFYAKTEWSGECLMWTAGKCSGGYGDFRSNGKMVRAHRYAWAKENGPIPDGMWIDHVCHNKACVRVSHLRLATPAENNRHRKGATAQSSSGIRNVYQTQNGRFRVTLGVGGRLLHFGTYETSTEAESVARAKRIELFAEFAGGGR